MSKIGKIVLLAFILLAACLCPLQHSEAVHESGVQLTWNPSSDSSNAIEASVFQNTQPVFQLVLYALLLLVLFASVSPPQARLRFHVRSFIPTLKQFYILNPIKYQSNYMANPPVLL
ncbi:hypothetical protein [Paenibacillus sacheonensis]|uniref:Uncharacterized protein n=1 Tax=Paenibacillus sacheonensis TaxID=742054 RepID=A0A7X4YQ69_9BACL|nr:hypothetical protein [Paenibacillus sacheonensis]MBM7566256.1 hypothetical protein [Paenibacillus sacheonensis]NBC70463.1 hypothetical protein [Paenibacillus sacheonensis]